MRSFGSLGGDVLLPSTNTKLLGIDRMTKSLISVLDWTITKDITNLNNAGVKHAQYKFWFI